MSKKIQIDIEVNGKMTKATVDAKALRGQLDGLDDAQKKTTKSGDKFQKGLKGVGEQSANASKNFSKFSAGMGGFVGVYAALAAQLFAISAAFNFLKRAGDLEALKAGQMAYASSTGIAMRSLAKDIQEATRSQVTFQDAAQAGAIGAAAGLSADQLKRLGAAAADASQILGRDVTDSFNRLVRGVTKAEPELLDELGIILRLKDATEAYARSLNLDVNSLTQFQKSQAVANDVLGQAESKYARILEVVGNSPNEFAQLGVAFDEIQNDIKEIVSALAGPLATVLKDTPLLAGAAFGLLLTGPMSAMGLSFGSIAESAEDSANRQLASLEDLEKKEKQLLNTKEAKASRLSDLAKKEVAEGQNKSKILQRLAKGEKLIGVDKANLRKALKAAEREYSKSGKITKGIFAGRDKEVLNNFKKTLDEMDNAMDQQSSRWERMNLRMRATWASTMSSIQAGFAKVTRAISGLFRLVGIIGIAAVAYKSIAEYFKEDIKLSDEERRAQVAARAADLAQKKIIGLAAEYENFTAIQKVSFDFAKHEFETTRTGAQALANVISTTFAPGTAETFLNNIKQLPTAIAEVEKNVADVDKGTKEYLNDLGGFAGEALDFASMIFGEDVVKGNVSRVLNKLTMDGTNMIERFTGNEVTNFKLSEELEASKRLLLENVDGLDLFANQMKKLGIANYEVFQNFEKDLATLRDYGAGNIKLTDEEFAALAQRLIDGEKAARDLGGNLATLQQQATATSQAFASMQNKLAPRIEGDQLRLAATAQLDTLKAIQGSRDLTEEEAKEKARLVYQQQLGLAIANHENLKKREGLRLQTESVRNYAKISKAQGNILKSEDKLAKAESESNFLIREKGRLLSFAKNEGILETEEVQRQLGLLQARIDLEDAKFKLIQQELNFLETNKDLFEGQERLQNIIKIMNFEKQAADFAIKTSKTLLDTARTRAQLDRDKDKEVFDTTTGANPFIRESRAAAQFEYDQAVKRVAIESEFIEIELANKLNQIDMEFKLLEAKNKQSVIEAKLLKARMREKPSLFSPQDIAAIDDAISGLTNMDLTGQKAAMIENANVQAQASQEGLERAVRLAAAKLEQEQPFNKLFASAVDSFEKSLGDAINAMFTSLYDKSESLGEQLRQIGRDLLTAVQKAVTQFLIVDPIMDALAKAFGKQTNAQKMANAITTAINDPNSGVQNQAKTGITAGAAVLKQEIKNALSSTRVKLECCEQKPTPAPPTPGVPDAGSPEETLASKTMKGINAAMKETELEEVRAAIPETSRAVAIENGIADPGNVAGMGMDGAGPKLTLPEPTKGFFSKLFGKDGSLGKMFGNLFGEGGSLGKLFNSFKGGFSGIFDNLLGSFGNMFGDLFGSIGNLFGGGAGGGGLLSGLASMIPGIGPILGGAMSLFGFKNGGIMNNGSKVSGYATGGIADGPNSGHLAMLHGREAVVPLPNGNSIPVQMKGNGGMQNNNVTVNVSTDGQVQSSSNGAMGENLGQVIAAAVQKELHNQKRAGGILNKHGAA